MGLLLYLRCDVTPVDPMKALSNKYLLIVSCTLRKQA